MKVFKLIFKNMFRHKLRSALTVAGIAIAVMAYGLIRTVIGGWYVTLDATSPDRLISRHAVSFIFPLPLAYKDRIAAIPGVTGVSHATWFQGQYIDQSHFFPRIAVEAETMFDLYPEFLVPPGQMEAFKNERNACILGAKTAKKYNLKIGDIIPVTGDIYPGNWQFVVRGIYTGRDKATDETQLVFHWEYLDEQLRRDMPARAGQVGWYIIRIGDPAAAAAVSEKVDALFKNSPAETKTETEKAFTAGFISMSGTIISAMQFISFVIVGIILLVLANTMVMTARERITEYAVLKTLGFGAGHIVGLILGESMAIAVTGGAAGMALTFPIVGGMAVELSSFFPVFVVSTETLLMAMAFAILVGLVASVFPIYRALTTSIVQGLRQIG